MRDSTMRVIFRYLFCNLWFSLETCEDEVERWVESILNRTVRENRHFDEYCGWYFLDLHRIGAIAAARIYKYIYFFQFVRIVMPDFAHIHIYFKND